MGFQGRGNGNAESQIDWMQELNQELGRFFVEAVDIIHRLRAENRILHDELEAVQQDNDLLLDDNRRLREAMTRHG